MSVPNNQERIARQISKQFGVETVADDGSVIVTAVTSQIAEQIAEQYGNVQVGDGVQQGSIWVNGDDIN